MIRDILLRHTIIMEEVVHLGVHPLTIITIEDNRGHQCTEEEEEEEVVASLPFTADRQVEADLSATLIKIIKMDLHRLITCSMGHNSSITHLLIVMDKTGGVPRLIMVVVEEEVQVVQEEAEGAGSNPDH